MEIFPYYNWFARWGKLKVMERKVLKILVIDVIMGVLIYTNWRRL